MQDKSNGVKGRIFFSPITWLGVTKILEVELSFFFQITKLGYFTDLSRTIH